MLRKALSHPVFTLISQIITEQQQQAYVIGGFVRDFLLKRPSKDIDIVVVGSGIRLAKEVARRLKPSPRVTVFKNFGTAMLNYQDAEIEFVGARKESYQRHSRKPVVEDGNLADDQNRRDFTINALAISLHGDSYGELIDPFDGLNDLKNAMIRTPLEPGKTFSDDPLRMMRAIRFATQLDFRIETTVFEAIKEHHQRLEIVSNERICDELNKIIKAPQPSVGVRLLENSRLLAYILPEIQQLKGVETIDGKGHKDNFDHSLQVLDNIAQKSDSLWLRWAALLHDIGKPTTKQFAEQGWTFHGHEVVGAKMVTRLFRRLRLPLNDKLTYVKKLVFLHLRPIVLAQENISDSAVRRLLFEAGDDIDDLMLLAEADITSKNNKRVQQYMANFRLVRQKLREIEEKDAVRNFQPPVSGEDIMQAFNIPPCRQVGIIKNAIKEAVLDGIIHNNREEAYQFMLKQGRELGLHTN